jgi:hypothetical protein
MVEDKLSSTSPSGWALLAHANAPHVEPPVAAIAQQH